MSYLQQDINSLGNPNSRIFNVPAGVPREVHADSLTQLERICWEELRADSSGRIWRTNWQEVSDFVKPPKTVSLDTINERGKDIASAAPLSRKSFFVGRADTPFYDDWPEDYPDQEEIREAIRWETSEDSIRAILGRFEKKQAFRVREEALQGAGKLYSLLRELLDHLSPATPSLTLHKAIKQLGRKLYSLPGKGGCYWGLYEQLKKVTAPKVSILNLDVNRCSIPELQRKLNLSSSQVSILFTMRPIANLEELAAHIGAMKIIETMLPPAADVLKALELDEVPRHTCTSLLKMLLQTEQDEELKSLIWREYRRIR